MGNFASENFFFLTLKNVYLHPWLLWQRHVRELQCVYVRQGTDYLWELIDSFYHVHPGVELRLLGLEACAFAGCQATLFIPAFVLRQGLISRMTSDLIVA